MEQTGNDQKNIQSLNYSDSSIQKIKLAERNMVIKKAQQQSQFLRRLRMEDEKFKSSLGNTARLKIKHK